METGCRKALKPQIVLISVPMHLANDKRWRMHHLCEFNTYLGRGISGRKGFPLDYATPFRFIFVLKENTEEYISNRGGGGEGRLTVFEWLHLMHVKMLGLPGGTPESPLGRGSVSSFPAPGPMRRIEVLGSLVGAKVPPRGS